MLFSAFVIYIDILTGRRHMWSAAGQDRMTFCLAVAEKELELFDPGDPKVRFNFVLLILLLVLLNKNSLKLAP
jgi:hypothetical protein